MPGCSRSLLALFVILLSGACHSVSSEQVASWKGSDEGREKIVAALRNDGVPLPVRAQAGAALAEAGWYDRLESALAGMDLDTRAKLIPAITPLLGPQLDAPDLTRAHDAREALFSLRRQVTTEEGTRGVDGLLLPALEKDLRAGRDPGTGHSAKEMLLTYGPAAAPVALRVLDDPRAPYQTAVEVLDKVGKQDDRDRGSAALVKRQPEGTPAPEPLLKALSTLSGIPAITYLETRIDKGTPPEKLAAAAALGASKVDKTVVPFVVKVASDRSGDPALREQMVVILEKLVSDEARKGLCQLISVDPEPKFRYRAFAAILKNGSGRNMARALEAFPPGTSFKPDEVRENLVAPIVALGFRGREETFQSFKSKLPLPRLVGIWTLEKAGFGGDSRHVEKLTGDKGLVKGFPPSLTIGAEAKRITAIMKGSETALSGKKSG